MTTHSFLPDYEPPPEEIVGTLENFMTFVEETASCWYWIGNRHTAGYGLYSLGRGTRSAYAHRFSYQMFVGPIPSVINSRGGRTCRECFRLDREISRAAGGRQGPYLSRKLRPRM